MYKEATELEDIARKKRRGGDNLFGDYLLNATRLELVKTPVTERDKLANLGRLLLSIRWYFDDPKKIEEINGLLALPGVLDLRRRGKSLSPEVKEIMAERGVTRQRAYQIIKERKQREAS